MARRKYSQKTFTINKNLYVECWTEDTNYGFRHLAKLFKNDWHEETHKATYYNRTWESYTYESVLRGLLEKAKGLLEEEKEQFQAMIKNPNRVDEDLAPLKHIAAIASLGNLFCNTQKDKNDWKERMLKAGLENKGLIMPDDWESLSEKDKERRLDGAINCIK